MDNEEVTAYTLETKHKELLLSYTDFDRHNVAWKACGFGHRSNAFKKWQKLSGSKIVRIKIRRA